MKDYILKPCPFCGGSADEMDLTKPFKHGWIGCNHCRVHIDWTKAGKQYAINAWNSRHFEKVPDDNIKLLAERNGIPGVFRHTIQEASELIQAITKFEEQLTSTDLEKLLGEVADIEVMLAQLEYILEYKLDSGSIQRINRFKEQKIDRQLTRFGLK